ncbi:MAG: MBL fold metallo-hydrolase [Anaerolineales bacterium]|jgi:metallo-beta-lactamase family protein|nr:MBL fold metallo-hydrolase [Anaerolineales bacterium]
MKIQFHGAAQTVTGSMHLIEVSGKKLLLECGLYQGPRSETYKRNQNFPFDPTSIDAVILSHAHIDHSGNLPNLVKQGFSGNIYTTPASVDLSEIMLQDAGHIQEADAAYLNYRQERRGSDLIEPLYTQEDAEAVRPLMKSTDLESDFEPIPGVRAQLAEAGHILGSAGVLLEAEENGKKTRIWFSGDIGRRKLPLLRDPSLPEEVDLLITEATYGDKPHRDPDEAYSELRDVVQRTILRGGKVIIPSFAVGRTQEIVYNLHRMMTAHEIPQVPVFVDSPLAVKTTDIFKSHRECFDQETWDFMLQGKHPALDFEGLTYIRSLEESKQLNTRKDPMVIISASGMAETGRILHHLKNNIEDKRSTIVIVSWQAPHTLGRRLAEREERVKIFGEVFYRQAEVATIGGLSAHAGQDLLLEYARAAQARKHGIFLVHSELRGAIPFKNKLIESGHRNVFYPELHQSVEI